MARNNDRDRTKRGGKDAARRVMKKKVDIIARDSIEWVDYKDINLLRKFMSDRGKIRARRVTGLSTQHQRAVATAIKTARELALLPYSQRTVTERTGASRRPRRSDAEAAPTPDLVVPEPGDDAVEALVAVAEDGEG
jgi:small subunit ribosomal protein S18